MSAILFDTHKFVRTLQEAGFAEQQAEAVLRAQRESISDLLEAQVVTKADAGDIHQSITDLSRQVMERCASLEGRMSAIEAELSLVKWIVSGVGFGVLLLVVKSFLP